MDLNVTPSVLESECSDGLLSQITRMIGDSLAGHDPVETQWFPGTARIRWEVRSVPEVGAAIIGDPRLTGRNVRDIIDNDFESCVSRSDFDLMLTSFVKEPIVVGEAGDLLLAAAPAEGEPESVTIEVRSFAHLHRIAASLQRVAIDRRLSQAFRIAEIAPPPTEA